MPVNIPIESVQWLPTIPIDTHAFGGTSILRSAYDLSYELNGHTYSALLIPVALNAPPPSVPESIPFVLSPSGSGPTVVLPTQQTEQQQLVTWDVDGTTYSGWAITPEGQPFDQSWVVTSATEIPATAPGGSRRAPLLAATGPTGQRSQGLVGIACYPDGTTVLGWADSSTNAVTLCVSSDWSLDSWGAPIVLGETSTKGVDLFVDPTTENLYAAWTGTDGDSTPNVAQFLTLPVPTDLPFEVGKKAYWNQAATGATAVAGSYRYDPEAQTWSFADLFVAFTGTDDAPGSINAAALPFGADMPNYQAVFGDQSSYVAPRTFQIDQAQQAVTWLGWDDATSLNLLTIDWGSGTATQVIVPPAFPALTAPALATEGYTYLAWVDVSNTLTLAYSQDLTNWVSQTQFDGAAPADDTGVSLVVQNTPGGAQLLVAFTDTTGAPFLSAIPLDPAKW